MILKAPPTKEQMDKVREIIGDCFIIILPIFPNKGKANNAVISAGIDDHLVYKVLHDAAYNHQFQPEFIHDLE